MINPLYYRGVVIIWYNLIWTVNWPLLTSVNALSIWTSGCNRFNMMRSTFHLFPRKFNSSMGCSIWEMSGQVKRSSKKDVNPYESTWIRMNTHISYIYIKHVIHLYPFHVCSEICPPFFTNPSWFCLSIGVCLSWVSQGSHQHHVWCSIGCLPPWSIPGSQRKTNPANCQDGHSPEKHLSFMLSSKIGMDSLPRDCKKEWFIISEMLHIEQI